MKHAKPPNSLVKQLVRTAQEARELALRFSERVEQKQFLASFRKIQVRITKAAESGKFEVALALKFLKLDKAALPGAIARLKELGFESEHVTMTVTAKKKGALPQGVDALRISFGPGGAK